MNIRVGYVPYLNMVPFHHDFGPEPLEAGGRRYEFQAMFPHALGLEAEHGTVDAGALSLFDAQRLSSRYEPVGCLGIGVKRQAQSVLLFSRRPMPIMRGECAVTDETSTSFMLLQVLLGVRYGHTGISYGRIASRDLFDGSADALLLIGDEALRARKEGVKGLPIVTDLGEEWYRWQGVPFVFARWSVRQTLRQDVKEHIELALQTSLKVHKQGAARAAEAQAEKRGIPAKEILDYWNGFVYDLSPDHERSIAIFTELLERVYA